MRDISRRRVCVGLIGLAAAPLVACSDQAPVRPQVRNTQPLPPALPPQEFVNTPVSPAGVGLDAVIDINHNSEVQDFTAARVNSNILAVVHKASEGGDWRDPLYLQRRAQAESVGLLWGAYHFGTNQYPGNTQAEQFLQAAQPRENTLIALDLELNEANPGNSMDFFHAEDFVRTILAMTGRLPLLYVHPTWSNGGVMGRGRGRRTLGGTITSESILSRCDLWLADYRLQPELPLAWSGRGWRFWQYAGDGGSGGPYGVMTRSVSGIESCDRNLFQGDAASLFRYWNQDAGRGMV